MPLACVLQHIRCEPPGLFSGPLRDRGYVVETVELDEGGRLPDWREVGLVLAMGGPMGAYDEAAHPWLAAEKRWIAAAVRVGTPYLGVCLGAQLLAASPVPCLARAGQQHELTITRQRLATVNKRGGAALVRLRHLPNAARWTYSHTIVSCK